MNLLLIDPAEVPGPNHLRLPAADRRAAHLRTVLRVDVGRTLRAGVRRGPRGHATVVALPPNGDIELALTLDAPPDAAAPIHVILAMPRPKVLARCLETLASFAVAQVDLCNAWRVDKSYLGSARAGADELAHHLRLGAEQGETTWVPSVTTYSRFMQLFEPEALVPAGRRLLADARDGAWIEAAWTGSSTVAGNITTIAIGPEGGWIDRERATFAAHGFVPARLSDRVLRVEAALATALGQLELLARADPRAT